MNRENTYLSIILAVRNDNYGGDFIQRLQNCITWNTSLLEKNKVKTEFVLINWNPIEFNVSLKSAINWPKYRHFVKFRIIYVPKEIHQIYTNPSIRKKLPLYEYLAKNTGIRRAKGKFILSMNPDILISENLIKKISKKKLKKDSFYRANRIDFEENNIENKTRVWLKGFVYKTTDFHFFSMCFNELICFWRKKSILFESFFKRRNWNVYYHNAEYIYHCNVSGDFMLLHRDNWYKLKGNPENTYLPLHTDALMVVLAGTSGLKEIVFSAPIFHQEHLRRFNADEKENKENRNAYLYFQNESQEMIQNKKPKQYNDENWGLAKFDLKEEIF